MRYILPLFCLLFFTGCSESNSDSPSSTPITIATYNLHDLNYDNAYSGVASVLKDHNIDVVLFQEIQKDDQIPLENALNALNIEYPYVVFSERGGYGGSDGDDYLACFSKYPVKLSETVVDGTFKDPVSGESFSTSGVRPILKTEITINGERITLYNLHLKAHSPFPDCPSCVKQRRAQSNELANYILSNHNPAQDHIVIAGDINCAVDEDYTDGGTLDLLSLKSDQNSFIPVNNTLLPDTATHNKYDQKFDHIILSPALYKKYQQNSVKIPTINPEPTDHKPVILKITF